MLELIEQVIDLILKVSDIIFGLFWLGVFAYVFVVGVGIVGVVILLTWTCKLFYQQWLYICLHSRVHSIWLYLLVTSAVHHFLRYLLRRAAA